MKRLFPLILIVFLAGCKTVPSTGDEPSRQEILLHIESESEFWTYATLVLIDGDLSEALDFKQGVERGLAALGAEHPPAVVGDLIQTLLSQMDQKDAQRAYLGWLIIDRYIVDNTNMELDQDLLDVGRAILRGMLVAADRYLEIAEREPIAKALDRPLYLGAGDELGRELLVNYLAWLHVKQEDFYHGGNVN